MQRVSSLLPIWDRAKPADASNNTGSAASTAAGNGYNNNRSSTSSSISNNNRNSRTSNHSTQPRSGRSLFSWTDRIGVNKTLSVSPSIANAIAAPSSSTAMGREAYWPTTLDRECEKAARILKSFCTDGFLDELADPTPTSPRSRTSIASLTSPRYLSRRSADVAPGSPTAVLAQPKKKIPPRVIQEAVGLAIFSCMRSGLWMSGSGGSGILIARKADGTWSPPSGILLHTSTVAFVLGVDIYDCVLVINSVAALELFTRSRVTLGTDVPLTVGPLVTMGLLENDVRLNHELGDTVLTYLKARGRHSPAQLSGSFVTERSNENERFYSDEGSGSGTLPIDILDILAGNVRKSIPEIVPLFEAIKAAEGRIDFDTAVMDRLSLQPAPGDADIADAPSLLSPTSPKSATFGVPDATDPDPFGIIALEMAGLEIREAGSKHRPTSHQFDFNNASPTSPMFASRFSHQSAEVALENGNRASILSTRTQATSMTDACTQTNVAGTPDTSLSPTHSDDGKDSQDAQDSTISRNVSPPIPELSVQTAPSNDTEDTLIGTNPLDTPPIIPPRNRLSHMAATAEKRSSMHLTVLRATAETDDQLSDGGETVASIHITEDERNEDADDEDEETDDLAEEGGDDLLGDGYDDLGDDDLDDEEEPVIFEVASTSTARPIRMAPTQVATQVAQVVQVKGALVNIPKRVPPPLPMRSPARTSRASKSDYGDLSILNSPVRQSFQSGCTVDSPTEFPDVEVGKSSLESPREESIKEDAAKDTTPTRIEPILSPASTDTAVVTSSPSPVVHESVADSTAAENAASGDDARRPLTPQAAEPTTSSIDESDMDPKTPRPDDVLTFIDKNKIHDPDTVNNKTAGETPDNLDVDEDHLNTSTVTVV